jgi:hypothetical protein
MVGTDGIVIASDLKWYSETEGMRETHLASKIKIRDDGRIAIACAESEYSLNLSTLIFRGFQGTSSASRCAVLERIGEEAMGWCDKVPQPRPQCHCLIAMREPFGLYSLRVGPEGQNCTKITDKRRAGDAGNPAMYFARFYEKKPASDLVFLASHIVLRAAQFNSDGVEGLEVLLCEEQGMRMLSDAEISAIKQRSEALQETLTAALS